MNLIGPVVGAVDTMRMKGAQTRVRVMHEHDVPLAH